MTGDARSAGELRSAAAFGLRWSAFARPVTELIQLVSMVILAHLIAPADFGRYAVALIAQEIAFLLIASGLTLALIQRDDLGRRHLRTGMTLGLAGGAILAVLMVLAAGTIVGPIFGARTAVFVELLAPLCLISAAGTVPNAMLSRRMAFRRLSEIEVLSAIVRAIACVSLAIAGFGGESLIYGTLAAGLTSTGVAWASAPPPLPSFDRGAARELLAYALPVSVSSIGWVGFSNVDYAIIGARLGALQAGLYFRAYTLAVEYQKKVGVVMQQVGFPVLSRTQSAADLGSARADGWPPDGRAVSAAHAPRDRWPRCSSRLCSATTGPPPPRPSRFSLSVELRTSSSTRSAPSSWRPGARSVARLRHGLTSSSTGSRCSSSCPRGYRQVAVAAAVVTRRSWTAPMY